MYGIYPDYSAVIPDGWKAFKHETDCFHADHEDRLIHAVRHGQPNRRPCELVHMDTKRTAVEEVSEPVKKKRKQCV